MGIRIYSMLMAFPRSAVMLVAAAIPTIAQPTVFVSGPGSPLATYNSSGGIFAGDFNGDGNQDLILATGQLLIGDGKGGLTRSTSGPISGRIIGVADFNLDGVSDLLVESADSTMVSVLLGSKTGTFTAAPGAPLPVSSVFVTDFNHDHIPDLLGITHRVGGDQIFELIGRGDGTFTTGSPFTLAPGEQVNVVADLNSDGLIDLAVTNSDMTMTNITGRIYLGSGAGQFTTLTPFPIISTQNGSDSGSLIVGDFNGDGILDLGFEYTSALSGTLPVGGLLISYGSGSGKFGSFASTSTGIVGVTPKFLVADLNNDGKSDVVQYDYLGPFSIDLSTGVTPFIKLPYNIGAWQSAAIADFNGDGKPDVAVQSDFNQNTTILLNAMPNLVATPATLVFNGVVGGMVPPQSFTITAAPGLTAASDQPWLSSSVVARSVEVSTAGLSSGTYNGHVWLSAPNYYGTPIAVTLNLATAQGPFGSFDIPSNGQTGLVGGVQVGGWALGTPPVTVQIWRDPVLGENPAAISPNGLVYIEDAIFVAGTRPDVAARYSGFSNRNDAGWGALLLSNELVNSNGSGPLGNGTYTLHAIATDGNGLTADLGAHVVTVNNAASALPFGAIDTPAPGATISGTAYVNFGWALTPQPSNIPTDGSSIWVFIDNQPVGHPVYNRPRSDIQGLFPGYANTNGAVGYFYINTTTLLNGIHQIAWSVTDNAGHTQGIGSRYFFVQN
jgi:hypothetical protein